MRPAWSRSPTFVHLGYRLIHALSPRMPLRASLRLAEWAADVQWRRSPQVCGVVEATRTRLLAAGPEGTARVSREVFRNFARYLVEFFAIHRPERPTLAVEGAGHLERCAASGRGAILLTGHLGNWEVGAMLIRQMGFPVSVVALPHPNPRTDRLFTRQRQRCGVGVIPLGEGAARRSLHSLNTGDLLGVLGDWDVAGDGVAVPFGAGSLVMPRGPAVLSLRSGAPVIPTFVIREGVWAFRLFIEPPIWPEHDGGPEGAAQPLTRRYAAVLERYVKRFPEQWLLFHEAIQPTLSRS